MFRWQIKFFFSVNVLHAQSSHSVTADKKNSDSDSDSLITDCKEGEYCIIVIDIPSHFEVSEPNLPQKSFLGMKFRKIKSPSTLFWVIIKQFTMFWIIVVDSVNISGYCGSLWVIVTYSGS